MTSQPAAQDNDWADADHSGAADDPWHSHTGETPPLHAHGVTSPRNIFLIGFVCTVLVLATMAVIAQYFIMGSQIEIAAKQEVNLGAGFADNQETWDTMLSEYGWVDEPNGVVRVPIQTAIDKVVADYSQTP